jgi:hypothetical protein
VLARVLGVVLEPGDQGVAARLGVFGESSEVRVAETLQNVERALAKGPKERDGVIDRKFVLAGDRLGGPRRVVVTLNERTGRFRY